MQKARFHHIRLNVTNRDTDIEYYKKFFGAQPMKYSGRADTLLTEKSYLLLNLVDAPPQTHEGSSLWHIGWSGVDGPAEFDWRVKDGIEDHSHQPARQPALDVFLRAAQGSC